MLWVEEHDLSQKVQELVKSLNISTFLATLLSSRGLDCPEEATAFLNPKLKNLSDPFEIPNLHRAASRIASAIENKEDILIIGDYDVDGITSTVILKRVLSDFGLHAAYVIPRRNDEGYGLTVDILNRGLQLGKVTLVIALDCGTNSLSEANFLHDQNVDLLVVDHHKPKGEVSPKPIILNPHLNDKFGDQWNNFCTVGLCFKLVHGLIKILRNEGLKEAFDKSPKEFLSLVALGTLADMVPLTAENRILTSFGLKHLRFRPSTGLKSLIQLARFNTDYPFDSEDITFKLAPRINACGRLNIPEIASELLLTENAENADELAIRMDELNEERKQIESHLTSIAEEQAEKNFKDLPAAVIFGQGEVWNPGVVGIVAGKLSQKLHKPVLVLAYHKGVYKGSGRSFAEINLVKALSDCEDLLESWGGHPLAVGLSVDKIKISQFVKSFMDCIQLNYDFSKASKNLKIDTVVAIEDLKPKLLDDISRLAPFGQENPEPVLAIKSVSLASPVKPIGNGNHFQFRLNCDPHSISGVAWNMMHNQPPTNKKIDLAFKLRWNRWNNKNSPQLMLEDWKLSDEH